MSLDQIGQAPNEASALGGRHLSPGAVLGIKGTASCGDCLIDIRSGSLDNLGEHFAGCGIDGIECLRSVDPLPIDEQLAGRDFCFRRRNHRVPIATALSQLCVCEGEASLTTAGGTPALHQTYFAVNVAGRFSTYAARPSLASSLWNRICWFSRSTARADSIGISQPVCTARLMRPTAFAALLGGVN